MDDPISDFENFIFDKISNSTIIIIFINFINFSCMFNYSTKHYLILYVINLSPKD